MYIVSYLALSIPAVIAGLFIAYVDLRNTALTHGGFVAAVAILALGCQAYSHSSPQH